MAPAVRRDGGALDEANAALPTIDNGIGDRDACGVGFVADRSRRASRDCLDRALEALSRLAHRGATGDGVGSADGAGVLTAIPWSLFQYKVPPAFLLPENGRAVGMCFLPPGPAEDRARMLIADALAAEGWSTLYWRDVPIDTTCLGTAERDSCPSICQVFATRDVCRSREPGVLRQSLHRARRRAEAALGREQLTDAAIVSLSSDTIVYKALVAPADLCWFYADLADSRYKTPFAIFHQRFSTNTLPAWAMAQPFHTLAHNGEINTVLGNRVRALGRHRDPASLPAVEQSLAPAVPLTGSDSRSLDGAIEQLRQAGFSLPHAFARLLPRAWENDQRLSGRERAFEQYQAALADPWEGPAAIAFSDGRLVGMTLDRNGFRPARIITSRGGLVCAGSEIGIFDIPDAEIERVTRLGPGEMLVVDLERGELIEDHELRGALAASHPYEQWASRVIGTLPTTSSHPDIATSSLSLRQLQRLFGYTREELEVILKPMAEEGREAIGSMGDDTPLAAFSTRRRLLSDYFRQRFAQVTNPPIDPLRERRVLSLRTTVGQRGTYLAEDAVDARVVALDSPILSTEQLHALQAMTGRPVATLHMTFDSAQGPAGVRQALASLIGTACDAVRGGAAVLVLTDRGCSRDRAQLPSLLATAAVYSALGRAGLGTRAGVVVDTGEARDAHQVAALLAFGAGAVCPWLAFETAATMTRAEAEVPPSTHKYREALEHGLLKIFSKMGVCTASAYTGSQLFEIIGLDRAFVNEHFPHTPCVPGVVTLESVAEDVCAWHAHALSAATDLLGHPGFHGFRRDGDHHIFNPAMVRAFHRVAGTDAPEAYRTFSDLVQSRPTTAIRDLLEFRLQIPIPIDEVEPIETICRRFFASAMSVGALGPEAHRTLAVALNRLGGRSNSGEGGEESERFRREGADWANSTTKQVASARFGVTPAYLASAHELQIKMAQGSKPGEGGQLPAEKVVGHIARLRYAQPGTALISPPPHHDIYSIEDLAQLIYDLRSFHPTARINVKLVSTLGVGVIAAGVMKAGADAIQISGHSGGTGASPRGSIKHAGLPWEIGLLEAHRLLTERGTRHRVVLQTDGGLVTGRDVMMAAALGADEFGFGTAAVVALGCVMARQCHLNTCPVGIATQRPDLRAKFEGTVDQVVTYFRMVAAEVRSLLADLGFRSIHEVVGRVDLLTARHQTADRRLDVDALLAPIVRGTPVNAHDEGDHGPAAVLSLNGRLLARAKRELGRQAQTMTATIRNTDRAVGATLAGYITTQYDNAGVPHAPVHLMLSGNAGQSLGAFGVPGLDISLHGAANDGVGKGLHGGTISISPRADTPQGTGAALIGNAALYGATGGRLFVAGGAGERFGVRNSGACAVVEGVGYHGCEYMTGGTVVILGPVGDNFAAGMTGGCVYVFDQLNELESQLNSELVTVGDLTDDDYAELHALVTEHYRRTASARAGTMLAQWSTAAHAFRKVTAQPSRRSEANVAALKFGVRSHEQTEISDLAAGALGHPDSGDGATAAAERAAT